MVPGAIANADDEAPVLRSSPLASAVRVEVEPRCSEIRLRSPEVKVRWTIDAGAAEGLAGSDDLASATEFRVDTSTYHTGFETGRFDSVVVRADPVEPGRAGELRTPSTTSAVVDDLRPGVYYHTRVLVRTPAGWVSSPQTGFLSSTCPADGLDRE